MFLLKMFVASKINSADWLLIDYIQEKYFKVFVYLFKKHRVFYSLTYRKQKTFGPSQNTF